MIRADLWRRDELVLRAEPDALFALPVTSAPLTWLTMSSALGVPDLVALGDATLTRGLATRESLAVAVDSWGSGRGSRALRAALPELRYGVMSRPETLLRLQIADAGLPSPEINVPVFDRSGRLVFRPDLSWPEFRVLVEYEGDFHRTSRSKFRSDIERMEEFADAGWVALRVTGDDVFRDPNRFLGRLSRRLVSRGLRPRELRQVAAAQP